MADPSAGQIQRTAILLRLIDRGFSALTALIRWGALVWIASYAVQAVGYLAGHDTLISVVVAYLTETDSGITITLSLSVGAGASLWAAGERKLRHNKVEYLQRRIIELETMIDPNRTTSGLTPEGRTSPHDE